MHTTTRGGLRQGTRFVVVGEVDERNSSLETSYQRMKEYENMRKKHLNACHAFSFILTSRCMVGSFIDTVYI